MKKNVFNQISPTDWAVYILIGISLIPIIGGVVLMLIFFFYEDWSSSWSRAMGVMGIWYSFLFILPLWFVVYELASAFSKRYRKVLRWPKFFCLGLWVLLLFIAIVFLGYLK